MIDREVFRNEIRAFINKKKNQQGEQGYAFCVGYMESTLADVLMKLSIHDEELAMSILGRFKA